MASPTFMLCSVFYFGVFIEIYSTASSACRIASFNAGLAPTVPYFEDRREEIVPALDELDADVVCLQEVMFSTFEPPCEKTDLRGFRPDLTQTRLHNHTRWLEARNFVFRN